MLLVLERRSSNPSSIITYNKGLLDNGGIYTASNSNYYYISYDSAGLNWVGDDTIRTTAAGSNEFTQQAMKMCFSYKIGLYQDSDEDG